MKICCHIENNQRFVGIIFNNHSHSTIIPSFILHHAWGLSSCILIASSLSKRRGAESRIELGPALQQADALSTELRRTPKNNGWLWNRLFDAAFTAFFLTAIFFLFCLRRDFFPGRPEPAVESAGQRRRAGGWDALQTEVASDPDPDPGFLSSNWNKIILIFHSLFFRF